MQSISFVKKNGAFRRNPDKAQPQKQLNSPEANKDPEHQEPSALHTQARRWGWGNAEGTGVQREFFLILCCKNSLYVSQRTRMT